MNAISWADFESIEIRVGTIIMAELATHLRKAAIRMHIDFGEEFGIKKSSAQITDLYDEKVLIGKQVLAVLNFEPKQIGNFISECLVLGVCDADGKVVLIGPDLSVPNGMKLH